MFVYLVLVHMLKFCVYILESIKSEVSSAEAVETQEIASTSGTFMH